jgi:tagatose-6-phosphate ketose/aldose isomerase
MNYLNYSIEDLVSRGGSHTAKEICNQPDLWGETYLRLKHEKGKVLKFLDKVWKKEAPYIILTGAGTSAFIGEALAGAFQREWGIFTRAIATTDVITHPENYFLKSRLTLLISFARSGDSPESLHTIKLGKEYCDEFYQLNITCNKEGMLARNTRDENSYVFLLPEESNDRSLAMTSSFSSMLLAGLLILHIRELDRMEPVVRMIQGFGEYILKEYLEEFQKLAKMDFERMVFLGSGPLFGVAHESHLKVQELTNGKIICKYDSFLGFRHGPKAVVNESTVIVYLLSNNTYVKFYEQDLIRSVNEMSAGEKSVAIGNGNEEQKFRFDLSVCLPGDTADIPEDFLSIFYILPAQIIGFYKSLELGLSPDSPSRNGAISRVVQGVKIYAKNIHE